MTFSREGNNEDVAVHFLKMLCVQEGGRIVMSEEAHSFFPWKFPQYVLADRLNPPSRFTPLRAALNPLLPGKGKASI